MIPEAYTCFATRAGTRGAVARHFAPLNTASRRASSRSAQPSRIFANASPERRAGVMRGIQACNPIVKDEYPRFASRCRDARGDPFVRRVSRFTTLHSLCFAASRSAPTFSIGAGRNRRCAGTPELVRVARLAASDTPNRTTAPASAPARVNGSSLIGLGCLPPTRTRTPGSPKLCGPGDRQRPFARAWIAPTRELGTNDPGQPRPPADSFETRRSPSISANRRETRAHSRAIRYPHPPSACAAWRLASGGRWAASESRSLARRSRRLERACAWLRGGPNEPATSTSCRDGQCRTTFGESPSTRPGPRPPHETTRERANRR